MSEPEAVDHNPPYDRNRRRELGLSLDALAAEAGVTPRQLHDYESVAPGDDFDPVVASSVGAALDRLERSRAVP